MVKVLEALIKVIDDKNHVRHLTINDIDVDSIVIKGEKKPSEGFLDFHDGKTIEANTGGSTVTLTEKVTKKEQPSKSSKKDKK